MTQKDRIVLVTGGAGGIGRGICSRFAETGATVLLADVDEAAAAAASAQIVRVTGATVHPIGLDVTNSDSRIAALQACDRLGGLDVLVNCAGVLRDARIRKLAASEFESLLDINLLGPLALTRLALERMSTHGQGAVVNLASRAWLGTFGSTAYSTAKGGLVGVTRSLALEVGRSGITVNAVAPGFIATTMTEGLPPEIRRRTMEAIPVGRAGTPHDVADAVVFLAGATYVTGQVLLICGGRSIGDPYAA